MTLNLVAISLLSMASMTADASAEVEAYPLDEVSRSVETRRGKVICPKLPLKKYKGTAIPYHRNVWVHPAFIERLKRFESVAIDVAMEIYGRAPRRMKHIGAYNCRRIGGYPQYLSEHGLGNGIDVAGFDFGPLPREDNVRCRRIFNAVSRSVSGSIGRELVETRNINASYTPLLSAL